MPAEALSEGMRGHLHTLPASADGSKAHDGAEGARVSHMHKTNPK